MQDTKIKNIFRVTPVGDRKLHTVVTPGRQKKWDETNTICLFMSATSLRTAIFFDRYLIWKKDDDAEVEVPPPAQLKKLIQDAGRAGATGNEGAPAATTGGAGGAASPLVCVCAVCF